MVRRKCIGLTAVVMAICLAVNLVGVKAAEPTPPTCKKAIEPTPKDGATDVLHDGTILKWSPGEGTPKYDVYFGPVSKYVEQAERANPVYVQASIGQKTTTFSPGSLERGKSYYWRVDEVDDADPNAVKVCRGMVWSFMVETPILPVKNITATASCAAYENMGPEKTIDGSGLTGDLHSAEMTDMWLSCTPAPRHKDPNDPNSPMVTPATWIQYEFARVEKLQEMRVWNWNSGLEKYWGLGVKDAAVEYSLNGTDWTALGNFQFKAAPGKADYKYNTVVNFAGAAAKFVRIVPKSSQRGLSEFGLSEVQFFGTPVQAREPSPASGTKNVALDGTLTWRVGQEAGSHKVYISTDRTAVEKGTAPSYSVSTNSFKLTSLDVQLDQTYYWRVDEVNEATKPTAFASEIWSFTAIDYLVVEDFEKYKGDVTGTWPAIVGAVTALDTSVVHGGKQALAINLDPTWVPDVGATGTITAPKNWTKNGVKKLVLFVYGGARNWTEPLVLRINGVDAGTFSPITNLWWTCWVIDLAPVASTLGTVNSITIGHAPGFGVRSRGAEKVYIDDIRLYNTKAPSLPDIVNKLVALNGSGATQGQFDTLFAAVNAADMTLLEMLSSDETYTVFAPTNAAFAAAGVSAGTDKVILNDILRNQIVAKKVSATNKGNLKSLEGSLLVQDANVVMDDLGGKAVITASTDALNGTIHTVNAVLMPFQMAKIVDLLKAMNAKGDYAGKFDTLLAAIGAAKSTVRDALDKRQTTLFAPTDDAFAALGYDAVSIKKVDPSLLSDILLYHIAGGRLMGRDLTASVKTAQGGELKYSKDTLTDALGGKAAILGYDVEGSNGVIHIIDAVAMPFAPTRLLDVVSAIVALNTKGDLAGQFNTLIAAADAADPAVLGAIAGKGPYTIFAPSDKAFAALGWDAKKVKTLDRVYLGDVLLYHAVAGKLSAKDALAAKQIKTIQGGVITRDPNDPNNLLRGAFKGAAKITTPDIEAFNGLIQVVDAVLLPYEQPAPPVVVPAPAPVVVPPPAPVVVPPPAPEPVLVSIIDTVTALNTAGDYKGQFDTFLATVASADKAVVNALSGTADHTLFIPTDDAFAALSPKIDSLDRLVVSDILLYHIAAGKLMAADVKAAKSITMLKGGSLQQANNVLTDNTGKQAKITGTDLKASNGVIHVINAVLLPAKL